MHLSSFILVWSQAPTAIDFGYSKSGKTHLKTNQK